MKYLIYAAILYIAFYFGNKQENESYQNQAPAGVTLNTSPPSLKQQNLPDLTDKGQTESIRKVPSDSILFLMVSNQQTLSDFFINQNH